MKKTRSGMPIVRSETSFVSMVVKRRSVNFERPLLRRMFVGIGKALLASREIHSDCNLWS